MIIILSRPGTIQFIALQDGKPILFLKVFTQERDGSRITGGGHIFRGTLYLASPGENKVWTLEIEDTGQPAAAQGTDSRRKMPSY